MATWKEIKAQRQGQTSAASSSWSEIKKSRGYSAPVNKEAETRRADAAGRQATVQQNRNAPTPAVREDEDAGIIPSVGQRAAAAKVSAKKAPAAEPAKQNLAMLNQASPSTREQIAERLGVLSQYQNPDSRYTMNDDIRKYVDGLYKRTGGIDVEKDRDYQWVKDSIAKGVPYNMARFGRLLGGSLKSWLHGSQGTVETLAGLGAEGLAAQYNDPGAAALSGLGAGLANGDIKGSMDRSVSDAMQRQKDTIAAKPQMLAEGDRLFKLAAQDIEDVGGNDTLGAKIVTMAAANAPDMVISMGIAGLTKAAGTGLAKVGVKQIVKDLAKKETRKAALITIGKQAARAAVPDISTLPMGMKSFAGTYQDAKAKGADDGAAMAAAFASAWVESAIESGGAQDVLKNAERGFKAWAKSALGEGSEELWQDWLAPAAEKYIAGIQGIKTFSMNPAEDSIFNPVRAGTAALGGAVIGGMVGIPTLRTPAVDPVQDLARQIADRVMPEAAQAEQEITQRQAERRAETRVKAEDVAEGKAGELPKPVKTAPVALKKHPDVKLEVRTYENGEKAIFEGKTEIARASTIEQAKTIAGAELSRRQAIANAKPIEDRNKADMKDKNSQSYQRMFPELREGIKRMAQRAMQDLSDGTKGEKIYITDGAGEAGLTETIDHTESIPRSQSELVDDLLEWNPETKTSRISYDRLQEALRNIVAGNELSNRQIEKEIEQKLDYWLTNGTRDFRTGNPVLPDKAYSDAKAFIYRAKNMEGKRGFSYSESQLAEAETALSKHADRMEKDFGKRPDLKIVEPKKTAQKNIVKLLETVGMRAYFIEANDEGNLAEYYDPNMPDVVFIKAGSKRDMTWAAGHGFFHSLKVNHPSLFKDVLTAFEKGITADRIEKYLDTFSETPEYQERLSNDRDLLMEEMLSDEMGNTWLENGFWNDLMEMSMELADKLRKLVLEFFDTIMKGFDNFIAEKQVNELRDKFVLVTAEVQERVAMAEQEGKNPSEYDPMTEKPEIEDLPFSARKKDEKPPVELRDARIFGDLNAVPMTVWTKVNTAMKRAGFDMRGPDDTKAVAIQRYGDNGLGGGFVDAFDKVYGLSKTPEQKAAEADAAAEKAIVAKAIRINGITNDFREAGYLLKDGRMLDFSEKRNGGRRGSRSKDHRQINEAFPENGPDLGYSGYMTAFMDMGNIRMKGDDGFELTQVPTKQQEAVLRQLILRAEDGLYVDLVKDKNHNTNPESLEYEGGVMPSRVFNDIRRFYETGEIRQSVTADFHSRYSARRKAEIEEAFKGSKVRNEDGSLKLVYHGSQNAGFTVFDTGSQGDNTGRPIKGFYFTDEKLNAQTYSGTRKDAELIDVEEDEDPSEYYQPGNYAVYLNIKNPLVVDFKQDDGEAGNWDSWTAEGYDGMDDVVISAIDMGYDGVIANNVTDEGRYGQGYGWGNTTYVVFSPEQIKSPNGDNPVDMQNPDIRYSARNKPLKKGDRVEYTGDTNDWRSQGDLGTITSKWSADRFAVKWDNGKESVIPVSDLSVLERKPFVRISETANAYAVKPVASANDAKPVEPGSTFRRVVWGNVGQFIDANPMDVVGLSGAGAYGLHVTNEPEIWADKLAYDYDRTGIATIIEIKAMPGDAITDDPQQVMPDERYGRLIDSSILITGREVLKKGVDFNVVSKVKTDASKYDIRYSNRKVSAFHGGNVAPEDFNVAKASEEAELGRGFYAGPESYAKEWAKERGGSVYPVELDTTNFFNEDESTTSTDPRYQKVKQALVDAGLNKKFVENNFGGSGTLTYFASALARLNPGKKTMFPGGAEIRRILMDAGFTGAVAEFRDGKQYVSYAFNSDIRYSIRAYHGSPHDHDGFTTEAIGSGEGVQAFGWGLYFASKKSIAEWYRNRLSRPVYEKDGKKLLTYEDILREYFKPGRIVPAYAGEDEVIAFDWNDGSWNVTVKEVRDQWGRTPNKYDARPRMHSTYPSEKEQAKVFEADGWVKSAQSAGKLYTVDIKPDEWRFLDWDKKISGQDWFIKMTVERLAESGELDMPVDWVMSKTGEEFYNELASRIGKQEASEFLWENGIAGNMFLDGTSRSAGDGSRNYVVFNDGDVSILEKYAARRRTERENIPWRSMFAPDPDVIPDVAPLVPSQFQGDTPPVLDIKSEAGFVRLPGKEEQRPPTGYTGYSDPELERIHNENRMKPETIGQKIRAFAMDVFHSATRTFPLINAALQKNAVFMQEAVRFPKIRRMKASEAERILRDITLRENMDLNADEFNVFERVVQLRDFSEDAAAGLRLPNGWTEETLKAEVEKITPFINDRVAAALDRRKKHLDAVKKEYLDAFTAIGNDISNKFKRENYFRHQVLEYIEAKQAASAGSKPDQVARGRGWSKAREGTDKGVNTDYLQAEYEVLFGMLHDAEIARMWARVYKEYDVKPELKAKANAFNSSALRDIIEAETQAGKGITVQRKNEDGDPEDVFYSETEWALLDFKKRIAMSLSKLGKIGDESNLWNGDGYWRNEVSDLVERYLSRKEGEDYEPMYSDEESDILGYLAELAEMDVEGSLQARAVFKAISERKAFIKNALGDKYTTWDRLIPDGYGKHQPFEGNYMFNVSVIPEKIMSDAMAKGLEMIGIPAGKVHSMMAMGGRRREYVIPQEYIDTMKQIYDEYKNQGPIDKAVKFLLTQWKSLMLTRIPTKVIKYNIRNASGDLESINRTFGIKGFSGKNAERAARELWEALRFHKFTPDLLAYRDMGGFEDNLYTQEIAMISRSKTFKPLTGRRNYNFLKTWDDFSSDMTQYRENVVRYSLYLTLKDNLSKEKNGLPSNFGASMPGRIRGLRNIPERAYQMAKDAVGAYDEVTQIGRWLRGHVFPFWSFKERNMIGFVRTVRNAVDEIATMESVGKKSAKTLGIAAMVTGKQAAVIGRTLIRLFGFSLALAIINMFNPNDDDLSDDVRNTPHLTLWKGADGQVRYFSRIGVMSDILEWFGLDTLPADLKDLQEGKTTTGQILLGMAKSPVNVLYSMLTPYFKTPLEAVSGQNRYPDVFKPRAIRDAWQYAADSFGVGKAYKYIVGKPVREGYIKSLEDAFLYRSDPEESAYYKALDLRTQFQQQVLKEKPYTGGAPSERANALYYYKQALKYKDADAAKKYFKEYAKLVAEDKQREASITGKPATDSEIQKAIVNGVSKSLDTLSPVYGITADEIPAFVEWLQPKDRDTLKRGMEYYAKVVGGGQ